MYLCLPDDLEPVQTSSGACWWWGWKSRRPAGPLRLHWDTSYFILDQQTRWRKPRLWSQQTVTNHKQFNLHLYKTVYPHILEAETDVRILAFWHLNFLNAGLDNNTKYVIIKIIQRLDLHWWGVSLYITSYLIWYKHTQILVILCYFYLEYNFWS